MRIALAQIISADNVTENLPKIEAAVHDAVSQGAQLVVFPEAAASKFGGDLREAAETASTVWEPGLHRIAAETGATIVAGGFRLGEGGRVRNTLLVVGPEGEVAAYDKVHLFDAFGYRESDSITPGTQAVRFSLDDLTFGLATCYDVRFPGSFIRNAIDGASVSLVCASWGDGPGKAEQWDLLVRARAVDSTTYVIAVGQGDPQTQGIAPTGAPTGIGRSAVIGPDGSVLLRLGEAEEVAVFDLDASTVEEFRRTLPVLANRNAEID